MKAVVIEEPAGWLEYVAKELPECVYAPGGAREAKHWDDIDEFGQRTITESMAEHEKPRSAENF